MSAWLRPGRRRRHAPAPGAALLVLATLAAGPVPAADTGRDLYRRCEACHTLDRHRTGPRHCGLIGRPAGKAEGFRFSDAMRTSGLVWTPEALDRFLAAPTRLVPGTTMTYFGIPSREERRELIRFLVRAQDRPPCR